MYVPVIRKQGIDRTIRYIVILSQTCNIKFKSFQNIGSTQLHVIITQHLFISNQMFFSTIDHYTMNQSRSVNKDHEFSSQHTQKGP